MPELHLYHTQDLPEPDELSCPRCGYDLTPMRRLADPGDRGCCSECGLEFTWGALIDGVRHVVPGFIEHARGPWATFVAMGRTWSWLALPHRFWRRVTIEKRVRMSRAALWVLVLLPVSRLGEIALLAGAMAIIRWQAGWTRPFLDWDSVKYLATYRWDYWHKPVPIALTLTSLSAFCALTLAALPQTRQKAKVRGVRVIRAWIYSHAPIVLWWLLCVGESAYAIFATLRIGGLSQWSQWLDQRIRSNGWFVTEHADEALLLCLAWQLWYWHTATSIGLRIQRAWQVTLAMAVISILGTLVVLGFTDPAALRDLLRIDA